MSQVSKNKIDEDQWQRMWKNLVMLIERSSNQDEVEVVLSGLLTETERIMVIKRLMVWILLRSEWSVPKICDVLRLSSATVYKFKVVFAGDHELNEILETRFSGRVGKPRRRSSSTELIELVGKALEFVYDAKSRGMSRK